MTADEWEASVDAVEMLKLVRRTASDRKLRLFAVACCRLFWDDFAAAETRTAIEVNERFADGLATAVELGRARAAAHSAGWHARFDVRREPLTSDGGVVRFQNVQRDFDPQAVGRQYLAAFMANSPDRLKADDMPMFGTDPVLVRSGPLVFRDIFGNPFRPVAFDPRWRTADTVGVASAAYEDRAFDRLPLLADALMDAGCDDEQVLGHCRSDGHVRGCWIVDLVLGKS